MALCIVCVLTTLFHPTPWTSIPTLFPIPVHKIYFNTHTFPPYSYFLSTYCNLSFKLPITNFTGTDYTLLFPISILPLLQNELVYINDSIIWYKHNEKQVNVLNIPSQAWYTSSDYPYRSN
jgi:hypothetical protein